MQSRLLPEAAQFEVLPILTQEQYEADGLDQEHGEGIPLGGGAAVAPDASWMFQAGVGSKDSAADFGSKEVAAGSGSKGSAASAGSGLKEPAESGALPGSGNDDFFGAEECSEEEEQEEPDPVFDVD